MGVYIYDIYAIIMFCETGLKAAIHWIRCRHSRTGSPRPNGIKPSRTTIAACGID